MKIVYIAHPIGGDVDANLEKIDDIIRTLLRMGKVVPFAPYLTFFRYLDDSNSEERGIGIKMNAQFFESKSFDELWVYGDTVSKGVMMEMDLAFLLDIPILTFDTAGADYLYELREMKNHQISKIETVFNIDDELDNPNILKGNGVSDMPKGIFIEEADDYIKKAKWFEEATPIRKSAFDDFEKKHRPVKSKELKFNGGTLDDTFFGSEEADFNTMKDSDDDLFSIDISINDFRKILNALEFTYGTKMDYVANNGRALSPEEIDDIVGVAMEYQGVANYLESNYEQKLN